MNYWLCYSMGSDGSTLSEAHWVFEPKDEYKGDFARAYFYMATCYGHDTNGNCPDLKANGKKNYEGWRTDNKDVGSYYAMRNDSYLEFQDWLIEVLITWHRQDPCKREGDQAHGCRQRLPAQPQSLH